MAKEECRHDLFFVFLHYREKADRQPQNAHIGDQREDGGLSCEEKDPAHLVGDKS